jgi:Protein of unknown function (DUF2628)
MRLYSVHAPPDDSAPESYAFVKDGFSWPALFVPPLFMLRHRLWLTLVWYVVFVLVVAWTGRLAGDGLAVAVVLLGTLLFALEANNIRRLSLESRGWSEVGASFGSSLDEAEARFFGLSERERPAPRQDETGAREVPAGPHAGADEPIIGLFPEPER